MTAAVRHLLTAFDALTLPEQREALAELLQRQPEGDISELALTQLADDLFVQMDEAHE